MPNTPSCLALLCGVCPVVCAQPMEDRSHVMLPTEMLQGRSMDAEFVDLNDDGMLDLIVAAEFGQNVVLFGAESGFAESRNALPRKRIHDSEDIATGDFDSNGLIDVLFVSEDDQTNELYLQVENGRFIDATDRLPDPAYITNAVLTIDMDLDGDLDIILGNQGRNILWINDGQAGFEIDSSGRLPDDARTTQDIEPGDLDQDGDLDLVIGNENGNRIWLNDGSGRFIDSTETAFPELPDIETREADLADFDGDGDLDLVLANVGWNPAKVARNRVLLNDGNGRFIDHTFDTPTNDGFTLDADCIDIDLDGDIDIVFGNSQKGPPVEIWINDGKGTFVDGTAKLLPSLKLTHVIDVEIIDVDSDGKLELYLANHISADKLLKQD